MQSHALTKRKRRRSVRLLICLTIFMHVSATASAQQAGTTTSEQLRISDKNLKLLPGNLNNLRPVPNLEGGTLHDSFSEARTFWQSTKMIPVKDAPTPSGFGQLSNEQRILANACKDAVSRYRQITLKLKPGSLGDALSDFSDNCTPPIETLPALIDTDWTGSPEIETAVVLRGVGVLFFDDIPVCSGLIIGPRNVLTARHCLFHPKTGDSYAKAISSCTPIACHTTFRRIGDPAPFRISSYKVRPRDSQPPRDGSEDYALIELDTDVSNYPDVTPITDPALPQPVFLVGAQGVGEHGSSHDTASPRRLFRASTPYVPCFINAHVAEQILHTCQTWGGFSGTPLIVSASGNRMTVAGLHLGPESEFKAAHRKVQPDARFVQNAAVRLDEAMSLAKE